MTVAAVILSSTAEGALTEALGQPRVRRLADIAWSGGAMPVFVLSPDPDGAVARTLTGAEATHALPAAPEMGPSGQMVRGAILAQDDVRGTTAVLLWPARMTWVGPETVTSLIEAHGTDPETMLLPAWRGERGWPVLLPLAHLPTLQAADPALSPDEVVAGLLGQAPSRAIELGDPGVTHDAETPYHELPAYEGPPDPPAGHTHEWGEGVAAEAGLPLAPDELD
jgi:CTP:molybdopterin cytidylyltransferase MocA